MSYLSNTLPDKNNDNILCKLKVDFIKFSIFHLDNSPDIKKIISTYDRIETIEITVNKYNNTTKYLIRHNNNTIKVIVQQLSKSYFPGHTITIHDPSKELLHIFDMFFMSTRTKYHIQTIEFAIDFYSLNIDTVYQFLKQYSLLKWRGKELDLEYKTTRYMNNIRKSKGKEGRIYIKDESECSFVRVEIIIKRNLLRKKEIHSIQNFISMDQHIPINYLVFKQLNTDKLQRIMRKLKNTDKRIILYRKIKEYIANGKLYEINKKICRHLSRHDNETFLVNSDYWSYFIDCFSDSSFINGDHFYLRYDLMQKELCKFNAFFSV